MIRERFQLRDDDNQVIDYIISFSKKLGLLDNTKSVLFNTIQAHEIEQKKLGKPYVPMITLNETYLGACLVPEDKLEETFADNEYAVPAYMMLKRFTH